MVNLAGTMSWRLPTLVLESGTLALLDQALIFVFVK